MLIVDQLKKNDPQLRMLAIVVLGGLCVLLAGLWWIQIVSARDYRADLETQSFRTVRIPAVRGTIFDRNHIPLAENRPTYNVSLFLEELRRPVDKLYSTEVARRRTELKQGMEREEQRLKRTLTKEERKRFVLSTQERAKMRQAARYAVASNVVAEVSRWMGQPLWLSSTNFDRHHQARLALPLPILANIDPVQVARFEEQSVTPIGVDLDLQSTRVYPFHSAAAHVLGRLKYDDSSAEGEEAYFSYRLPDYRGVVGVEWGFDRELRGSAGAKSVLVNNMGYRHTESLWSPAAPGQNIVLTIDLKIQQAAEAALQTVFGPSTRGAAVVMEVQTGDLLALASSPSLNPNHFVTGFPRGEWQRITELQAEKNRATQENYAPGSVFKPVVGLAALESGLDPNEMIHNPGYIVIGRRSINDLAAAGDYDFKRAFKRSSNTYFITNGLRTGVEAIISLGEKLHFGQRTGLPTRQETTGIFPDQKRLRRGWSIGDTANLCIGQGQISVTPLQMAVMTAAIANGGKVLQPRLVDRIECSDPTSGDPPTVFESGMVRNELGVKPANLKIVQDAMLADVEDNDGTGKQAAIPGYRICGKTGTAEVTDQRNVVVDYTTWFISYAPYENPRYAVVVMIESGGSGGGTCAPLAKMIYQALLDRDRGPATNGVVALKN